MDERDESTNNIVDYYKILECDRTASLEEIKKNYQRLVLITHPDKLASEADKFPLIQTAWSILRDPERRRQYDAELSLRDHTELLLFDSIMLEDMEFDSEEGLYTYNCRCGGIFVLASDNKRTGKMVIGCDECSFALEVTL